MPRQYVPPTIPDGHTVVDLVPENSKAHQLTPLTKVTCINRGRKTLSDMFDGTVYVVPPGFVRMDYGAAVHFQRRQIVPGTKNLEIGAFKSWIGIINVDDASMCEPFTAEELERYGEAVEAIDRSAMSDPADRDVTLFRTSNARASMPGQGLIGTGVNAGGAGPRRPSLDTGTQASDAAKAAAGHIMDTPQGGAAAADTAAALADGWAPPADTGASASADVPSGAELAAGLGRARRKG